MNFYLFTLIGFIAQLIDGTLGMGFGLTSSTILITAGTSAALASAAVHISEIGTTLASGVSHWHRENVDMEVLYRLAIPGGIGALAGATFLSSIDIESSKLLISSILFVMGFVLLYRIGFSGSIRVFSVSEKSPSFFQYLGFSSGFVDAAGGGGWGPIVTPTLLATTSAEPRKVIGTVSAAEFIVALCASLGFLLSASRLNLDWSVIGGLAFGGIIAAPIAAKIVRVLPARNLGIIVALGIIITNAFRLLTT